MLECSILKRVYLNVAEMYGAADGSVPATFEILYMIGWKPHHSQVGMLLWFLSMFLSSGENIQALSALPQLEQWIRAHLEQLVGSFPLKRC